MLNYLEERLIAFNARAPKARIYILPTRVGLYFSAVIFILFIISFSYGHSLAYSASFILVSVLVISLPYTNYNLNHLKVDFGKSHFIHEAEGSPLELRLHNLGGRERYALEVELTFRGKSKIFHKSVTANDIGAQSSEKVQVFLSEVKMGHYQSVIVKLKSSFPFGLFYSWTYFESDLDLWVFPKKVEYGEGVQIRPISFHELEKKNGEKTSSGESARLGEHDDFSRHVPFEVGHSQGRVDWKLFARSSELYIKEFEGELPHYLRMEIFETGKNNEQKIRRASSLAAAIAKAHDKNLPFQVIAPEFSLSSSIGRGALFTRDILKQIVVNLESDT